MALFGRRLDAGRTCRMRVGPGRTKWTVRTQAPKTGLVVAASPTLNLWKMGRRQVLPPAQSWLRSNARSEEHTSELQSLMRNSYAVFCLKTKKYKHNKPNT